MSKTYPSESGDQEAPSEGPSAGLIADIATRCCTHMPPLRSRNRQHRVATVPIAIIGYMPDRAVSAAPLSNAGLAKFPNRQ